MLVAQWLDSGVQGSQGKRRQAWQPAQAMARSSVEGTAWALRMRLGTQHKVPGGIRNVRNLE